MRKLIAALVVATLCASVGSSQVAGGSAGYGRRESGREKAEANEKAKRSFSSAELPASPTSVFLDASVLMNVKADEMVAVFAIAEEAPTVAECGAKVEARVAKVREAFARLVIPERDVTVDFVVQNRVYGFEVTGDLAREKMTGYELKKNVSVRCGSRALMERCIEAASAVEVFDLVKVDYVVKNIGAIQSRLMEEATRVVRRKSGDYARLLGVTLRPAPQVLAERHHAYYPTEMYDSYVAQESEDVSTSYYRQNRMVQSARKPRTFYYNPLDGGGFDAVVNPVVLEPVVQFTLYLKVRAESVATLDRPTAPAKKAGPKPGKK
ncbi:MAG: SIMPL domain-containing protein [Fimbriimonadaceae bacterium]|nr:SIMPL domain-containing protein [Fimbriimonadaceae bacterium]